MSSNFTPSMSSDEIYRGQNTNRCLSDDLDTIEADIYSLETTVGTLGNTYALKTHTHSGYATTEDVVSVQDALSNKANVSHTHDEYATTDNITAIQDALNNKANISHTHTEYSPTSHTHAQYATTTSLDALTEEVGNKANANHTHSGYASVEHTHDNYATTNHTHSNYALSSHTHSNYATVNALDALDDEVSGKAALNHTHSEYSAVGHTHDNYAAVNHTHSNYASSSHTHNEYATTTALSEVASAVEGKAAASHTHDDRYYTENEVDTKLSGKANSNHTHTIDNTLSNTSINPVQNMIISAALDGKVPVTRTVNGKALSGNITISASDVGADVNGAASNALASANAYTDSKIDSIVGSGASEALDTIGELSAAIEDNQDAIELVQNALNSVTGQTPIATTEGDGSAYTATVPGITELKAGVSFIMVPHVKNTVKMPTLNVNGLGAKNVRRRLSANNISTIASPSQEWIYANKPIEVMYDGLFWVTANAKPDANDIYGVIPVANGGTGGDTVEEARTNLDVYSKSEVEALIQQAIANL